MSEKYIYTMSNLSKKHGDKKVLSEVNLSFYPGAKIGVLGKNGTGKSTLLRIMAGEDKDYDGEAQLMKGYKVGYLSQEPKLESNLDVLGNVMLGVKPIKDLLDRYEAVNAKFAEPDADYDALLA